MTKKDPNACFQIEPGTNSAFDVRHNGETKTFVSSCPKWDYLFIIFSYNCIFDHTVATIVQSTQPTLWSIMTLIWKEGEGQ